MSLDWIPQDLTQKLSSREAPELALTQIEEPPCKGCKHWNPQLTFRPDIYGQVVDGIQLCWSPHQHHDFSCFEQKVVDGDRHRVTR